MSGLQSLIDPIPVGTMVVKYDLMDTLIDEIMHLKYLLEVLSVMFACTVMIVLFEGRRILGSWTRVWREFTRRTGPS
jgi:hypothetical protein